MSAYEYQAVDEKGNNKKGLIEADTARQARSQLRGMGLMPVDINEVSNATTEGKTRLKKRQT